MVESIFGMLFVNYIMHALYEQNSVFSKLIRNAMQTKNIGACFAYTGYVTGKDFFKYFLIQHHRLKLILRKSIHSHPKLFLFYRKIVTK